MKRLACKAAWLALVVAIVTGARAQTPNKPAAKPVEKPTIATVLDRELGLVEREVVSAAEAMPEEKYSFVPSAGEFKGVRTFAEQVKHVAGANNQFFRTLLGEKPPADDNGPDALKTKPEIVKYLKDSYALGHRAIATITPENAVTPLEKASSPLFGTRLSLANAAVWHSFDHYGQMVVYLRLNGIIPPASRPRPAQGNG